MPDPKPCDLVYELLVQNLTLRGHLPVRESDRIQTGHDGFTLQCGATEALKHPLLKDQVYGSVEIHARVKHPDFGEFLISDLVSTQAATKYEVVANSVQTYMNVTLPPLLALFDPKAFQGTKRTVSSVNHQGVAVNWNQYSGEREILNDPTSEVTDFLKMHIPLAMIITSMVPVLAETRLHWCKIYGERTSNGVTFGCAIDGKRSPDGKREMEAKFTLETPPSARWAFREFLVFAPAGTPDETAIAHLKEIADAHREQTQPPPPRKSWWPFSSKRS